MLEDKEPVQDEGVKIVGNSIKKGVTIYDKTSKTEDPPVEINVEDEIRKETGGEC